MNKHYFSVMKSRGWFRIFQPRIVGLTKVHLDFFSATLISRKTGGASVALFIVLQFASSCRPDYPGTTAGTSGSRAEIVHPDGKAIFRKHCVTCHGADGTLGLNGAGDLTKSVLTQEARITQITKGKNLMTPFEGILSPEEIRAVAAYSETLKK
ncbi:MAG: cytochrome c [Saprospiraceae bacterium]|nr:cytochrome c [Saprospiraceae bacterium]